MQTAVPVSPASITGPSQTTGRPVAMTTRAPASWARRSASAFRRLTRMPSRSSRVPSMSETTSRGAWVTREGASTSSFSQFRTTGPTRIGGRAERCLLPGQTQHSVQIGVAEQAARVDGGPNRADLVEPWVTFAQLCCVQRVQLPPVRAAAAAEQDVLDGEEILG